VTLAFDGTIESDEVELESGKESFDASARAALREIKKFPQPPNAKLMQGRESRRLHAPLRLANQSRRQSLMMRSLTVLLALALAPAFACGPKN